MIDIDGTEKKKNLGANAMLAVSLAVLKASSVTIGLNLFERIAQLENDKIPSILPVPMLNISPLMLGLDAIVKYKFIASSINIKSLAISGDTRRVYLFLSKFYFFFYIKLAINLLD